MNKFSVRWFIRIKIDIAPEEQDPNNETEEVVV
jgi:hypothetical protein